MRTTTMTPIRRLRCIEGQVNRDWAVPVKSGGCECAACTDKRTYVALRHAGPRTTLPRAARVAWGGRHEAAVPCNGLRARHHRRHPGGGVSGEPGAGVLPLARGL